MGQSTRMPVTAMLGASVFCSGVTFAATMPYGAIVGIETLGLSNEHYAAMVSISSLVGALVTMFIGYASDRLPDRRILVLMAAVAGATGMGLVYFGRSQMAFIVAITVIWPFGFAMFSQNFAYVRVYYNARAPERAHFMITALRTVFSVAWVIVPPLAGYIAALYSVFDVFLLSALAYLACGVIFAAMMTDPATRIAAAPIAARDATGMRGFLPTPIIAGLVGILIINIAMRLVGLAMPLSIVTRLGGTVGDVGIYAGIAAALEIPFMLMWGYLGRWLTREAIIIGNGLLLGVYILLVSQARSVMDVFLLQAINGIAAAALLSVTISYMQDAIKGRVGLSTSLMDVVGISATLAGAAVFGVLSAGGDYQLLLVAAAGFAVVGGLVMLAGNTRQLRMAPAD
ncbi:MFS transporter [Devosia oryziradicis]|uniref:MFS transporter n=1 Tax=Devosia oryziradicis TaxID=2801335 RepID=A0ABX7BWM9_9HYPH|nr:MFS transporter [Devosia oryziradicis]QQR35459.1 MFS transporter [Devosia oryziradicis]